MKYREVARKLSNLGCVELQRQGKGSQRKWFNPATNSAGTLPDWGRKDLKLGTLRSLLRQLGIEWSAFEQA
jgi:predicted RNA binding protein YcfA (HicA-like mRNA interferase family)